MIVTIKNLTTFHKQTKVNRDERVDPVRLEREIPDYIYASF